MRTAQLRHSANPHPKIEELHRKKLAVIYVRQSSLYQVENHLESQKRQYQLTDTVSSGSPDDTRLDRARIGARRSPPISCDAAPLSWGGDWLSGEVERSS